MTRWQALYANQIKLYSKYNNNKKSVHMWMNIPRTIW